MLNADKTQKWKSDTLASIDYYNDWFLRFAPTTYREQRVVKRREVKQAFTITGNLQHLTSDVLAKHPEILSVLRMSVAPPIAQDRLAGLAYAKKSVIACMEGDNGKSPRLPPKLSETKQESQLAKILDVIREMLDTDILPWIPENRNPKPVERSLSVSVITDRLCGSASDPIVRNAQESRQLCALAAFLKRYGYREIETSAVISIDKMPRGCYTFRKNVDVTHGRRTLKIPIDCIISRHGREEDEPPVFIEAKSAGDFTNTNKRRKEEAVKLGQLKKVFGKQTRYVLFLCGYFDAGYLGYEAAEGIDWVWEHRVRDLLGLGLEPTETDTESVHEPALVYHISTTLDRENERFTRQKQVDASKPFSERNAKGQYSTPFELARRMVEQTLHDRCLEVGRAVHVLEPACGSGVFLSALLADTNAPTFSFTGIEIDPAYADICKSVLNGEGIRIVEGDFFTLAENTGIISRVDMLVANPPYVRNHHIPHDEKKRLQGRVLRDLGVRVSGLSGLYVYFILLADKLLENEAIASWLIPCEFLYTNYGVALREYLLTHVTLLRIHMFNTSDIQFDDALVSSCIVTYRKSSPSENAEVEVTAGRYAASGSGRKVSLGSLTPRDKWTFSSPPRKHSQAEQRLTVGDLFRVTRGIATGNNRFFVLDAQRCSELKIEKDVLTPILPGPRFLRDAVIHADPDGEPVIENRRYLLSVTTSPAEVARRYPTAYRYLQEGVKAGVPSGGLCRMRKIWYQQEKREPPQFLVSYMGREDEETGNAIRFFLNHSNGIATNGFICLYPKPFLTDLLAASDGRAERLLACLNATPPECVRAAGRSYGGGLKKIEPKELSGMFLSDLPEWLVFQEKTHDLFALNK